MTSWLTYFGRPGYDSVDTLDKQDRRSSQPTGRVIRAQELCESRGGRPGLSVPNSPYSLCGRKATLNSHSNTTDKLYLWGRNSKYSTSCGFRQELKIIDKLYLRDRRSAHSVSYIFGDTNSTSYTFGTGTRHNQQAISAGQMLNKSDKLCDRVRNSKH